MPQHTSIGFLHPGAMGVSLAASAMATGCEACWVSAGRSSATHARAEEHKLTPLSSLEELAARCSLIVSICPPSAAETVLRSVLEAGFAGAYLDANAISPMRATALSKICVEAGVKYIDGSVIGGPAWQPDETVMYLSGPNADEVAACFQDGLLVTRVIGYQPDRASALKACYAAYTKGSTAMLCAVVAAASALGVESELAAQWDTDDAGSSTRTLNRIRRVTAKAWRFEGEMEEIAATMREVGIPDGFHIAAAEVYSRIAGFKDHDSLPDLNVVISELLMNSSRLGTRD